MRVIPRPPRACPWYLRPLFWWQRRKYGAVPACALFWARSPRLFLAFWRLAGAIDRSGSPLDADLRALVMLRVCQLNRCRAGTDLSAALLLERGAPPDKVDAVASSLVSNLFDERERVALEYAEAMTLSDRRVDDDLMARLRPRFDNDALVELTALIAFQNMASKFDSALDVPPQGFCRLPGRPLPEEGGGPTRLTGARAPSAQ